MTLRNWTDLLYLVAAVLFILGIKGLTHPRKAVRGNMLSAGGMMLAIAATVLSTDFNLWIVLGGLAVGSTIGIILATRVKMTSMPEMVALLNGFGGGASILVAAIEAISRADAWRILHGQAMKSSAALELYNAAKRDPFVAQSLIAIGLTGLIGAITFWGSLVAWAKLSEMEFLKKIPSLPSQKIINGLLLFCSLSFGVLLFLQPSLAGVWYLLLAICASALGIFLVNRIGGADMPVVISLLNSYSGLAGATTGFVVSNNVLIITGSLVGASGIILTRIMCKAMNRSLANVLFGGIDAGAATASADDVYGGRIKSTSADEIGMLLDGARRVVIVPGYGLAVAQAQYAVRDLYKELADRGVDVQFAIHPVAGRMPGHMNVLLAEVDIPYDRMQEMDSINAQMREFDVALVIGANDVVNPDARTNPQSPIAGMPIINVDEAKTVVVVKRSLSPGFAGIPNPLFALDNALMYFADGKKAVLDLVVALKGQ